MKDVKHILLIDQQLSLDVDEYRIVTHGDGFENASNCTRSLSNRPLSHEEEFVMQTLSL